MYYYRIWITGFLSPRRTQLTVRLSDTVSFLICRSCNITHVGSDNRCSRTHQRLAAQRAEHRGPSTVLLPDRLRPYPRPSESGKARLTKGVKEFALVSWWILEDDGSGHVPSASSEGDTRSSYAAIFFVLCCCCLGSCLFIFGTAGKKTKW